jgi:hypothetical protein
VACRVGPGFDLHQSDCLRLIREHYNRRCQPPWSDKELEHKVEDAYEKETRRGWLLNEDRPGWSSSGNGDGGVGPSGAATATGATGHRKADFTNFSEEEITEGGRPKTIRTGHQVDRISNDLEALKPGWPKREDDRLFVQTGDYEPHYLETSTQLFAWIDPAAKVRWAKGDSLIPQERFYEYLRMTAPRFDAIETLPHWPPLPGIYYMHRPVPETGGRLDGLLDFFRPATDADRELIRAMIFTAFWGGLPGSRPAFLLTGPDGDQEQGRGVGKTTLSSLVADLAGGSVEVSPTDPIAEVKTRLLSAEARQKRVACLDNVKTPRFSRADLEGLITAATISGKELYRGEGRRPNTVVWFITLNAASLSKDMAQRCICIKLARPEFKADWESNVRAYVREHRWAILADVKRALEDEPLPMLPQTRWAAWERDVLSKTDMLPKCQDLIVERQNAVDDDNEERDQVVELFEAKLKLFQHPRTARVRIPSITAFHWLKEISPVKSVNAASAMLRRMAIKQLSKNDKGNSRGWIWTPEESDPDSEPWDWGAAGL